MVRVDEDASGREHIGGMAAAGHLLYSCLEREARGTVPPRLPFHSLS